MTRISRLLARAAIAAVLGLAAGGPAANQTVQVADLGVDTGFQDTWNNHHKRGRALVAADFDLDGRVDFFVGNPGDESFVIRDAATGTSPPQYQVVQTLLGSALAWGGAAADYDNDGDYDLFVSIGGNEGIGLDYLFRNMWFENGESALSFVDVTDSAGVRGPVPQGGQNPIPTASANAVWADYDRDGDVDLFVNGNVVPVSEPEFKGRNTLWRNEGDGTFFDVTPYVGLGATRRNTRHSTFFDYDNDGDLDLYETNFKGLNVLWRNRLVETGTADFVDVTGQLSQGANEDLGYPWFAYASAAADFDNDGWQDLLVTMYPEGNEPSGPYGNGHALFMNQGGTGFVNVAAAAQLNNPWMSTRGAMGFQIGDLDGDGVPDVFFGNGSPDAGQHNQLFLSDSPPGGPVHYVNRSSLIDFPAPTDPSFAGGYPPYPYRSHGAAFVDVDADGQPELTIVNGGPAQLSNTMREPNRLFDFDWSPAPNFLHVRPVGNGTTVSRDAIGTRAEVWVSRGGGTPWRVCGTLFGGSGFSAQNGFTIRFGLADADTVHSIGITWPDGSTETIGGWVGVNSSIVVPQGPAAGEVAPNVTATLQGGQVTLSWDASCAAGDFDYAIYEGAPDGDFSGHAPRTCSTGGSTSATFTPSAGSSYFLVVPHNAGIEGSYGLRGDGSPRGQGQAVCLPRKSETCGP